MNTESTGSTAKMDSKTRYILFLIVNINKIKKNPIFQQTASTYTKKCGILVKKYYNFS